MGNLPSIGLAALLASGASLSALADAGPDTSDRAVVEVIGTAPLPDSERALDKIPGSVQTLTSDDFARDHSINILDTLSERAAGVFVSDLQGNEMVQDLRFRGFSASPLQGTPQGLAIYQNGLRINEAFGDTVNWDLIPEAAIARADLFSNNPVFGLNAIGGAVSLQMKNGFTAHGLDAEIRGGSFGLYAGSASLGYQRGAFSVFLAVDGEHQDGWRDHSPTDAVRFYGDLGWRGDAAEFHLIGGAAGDRVGAVGPTPIERLRLGRNLVYTGPQTTSNQLGLVQATGRIELGDGWAVDAVAAVRKFDQAHVDGNDGDFEGCSGRSSYPGMLCLDDDGFAAPPGKPAAWRDQFVMFGPSGQSFPFVSGATYGTVDRTWTQAQTASGSVQATRTGDVLGRDNVLILGGSIDSGDVRFRSSTELGVLDGALQVGPEGAVPGTGLVLHNAGNPTLDERYLVTYRPVDLDAGTLYSGIYGSDSLDVTPALTATVGFRLNIAHLELRDRSGASPDLDGSYTFRRFNPMAGITYKVTEAISAYAGYSEANRAPTPLELDCADPNRPCLLENSLVADPPLKQVEAHSYEVGLRGRGLDGALHWNFGLFRTESDNDIVSLASSVTGRGYYTNVPETLRQGFQGGLTYRSDRWLAYGNYSFTEATYRFTGTLASPNNPRADANGNIPVTPGKQIPGIPRHQLKLGADYAITASIRVGTDVTFVGSQYFIGDDANQNAKLPPYWVANLHATWEIRDGFEMFGGITNLFDRNYATYGTYFETEGIPSLNFSDPRSISPGAPRAEYGGVRIRW